MKAKWKEMKTKDDICWLSTEDALTHRKLENSHLLSTGSPPPEKTTRVKKKKDSVILRHLNKIPGFYTTPYVFSIVCQAVWNPNPPRIRKMWKDWPVWVHKCDCTRFKVHHFCGPGLSDECSPVSSGSWNLFLRALAWAWLDCQSQASLLWSTHMKMAQNWVISGIQKTRCFKKQKQNSGGSLYLFFCLDNLKPLNLFSLTTGSVSPNPAHSITHDLNSQRSAPWPMPGRNPLTRWIVRRGTHTRTCTRRIFAAYHTKGIVLEKSTIQCWEPADWI